MNRRKFFSWAAGVGAFLAWPFQAKAEPEPEPEPKPFRPYDLGEGDYAVVFTEDQDTPEIYATGRLRSLQQSPPIVYDFATGKSVIPEEHYRGGIDSCGLEEPYAHPRFAVVAAKATSEHQTALLIHRAKKDTWAVHEVEITGYSTHTCAGKLEGWSVHFKFVPLRPGHAVDFFRESLGEPYVWIDE
jgi:hypothetical protein